MNETEGVQMDLLTPVAPVIRMHLHIERSDGQGWTVWMNRKQLWASRWEGGTTFPGLSLDELRTLLESLAETFGGNHA